MSQHCDRKTRGAYNLFDSEIDHFEGVLCKLMIRTYSRDDKIFRLIG